ncbi:MAG: T9SS type A sorting domain-containing protein, partial [Bacteroidetes bacterium]|nr:T9SS type A sorting domain-containing protein [Bacteroidota bacterium]
GRQVWQRSYQNVQASLFTANVDLRGRPKGVYLLRVQSGDAQALQRVVVE